MKTVVQDLRYGPRMLRRSPGFTVVAVLTLAVGIGANTAIFTVANALLLRPLPYRDSERLVLVTAAAANQPDQLVPFSYPRFTLMHDQSRSFNGFAAFTYESFNLTGDGDPEQIASARVSWDFFDVLGVRPALGLTFHWDEDRPGGERVAVLSHRLWMRRFGGARNIVGHSITLDSRPYTVVGVLRPGFLFPLLGSNIDIWTPKVFELNLTTPAQVQGGSGFLQAVARLAPGVSLAQANAEMEVLNKRYRSDNPNRPDASATNVIDALSLQQQFVSNIRESLLILVGVVGIVLLIACANVSSLLLSRALGRRKEITIRTALGASRGALVRQLLTESLLLAAISGTVGILLGYSGTHLLSILGRSSVPQLADVQPDARVLAFTIAISFLSGMLFGLMPALHVSRVDLNAGLREGRGSTGGRRRNQARNLLVVSQVTLAVILLVAAGLLIRSFLRLETASLGLKQMIIPPFALPQSATVADWMRATGEANKLGERAQRAGVQLGFHNHDFEFHKIDGELIYDKLMAALDPAAVKMQFQVEVVRLGYRAADYFERYPGRFISIHLSDWSAADADGKEVPLGQGVVDWRKTFTAARTGGVKNYFLEMDPANMKASLAYLRGLS